MKTVLRLFLWIFLVSFLAPSCKSESDYLKDATKKMNELAEAISNTRREVEFDRLVADYNNLIKGLPKSIQEMTEDDLIKIDGGKAYVEAVANLDEIYMGKSRYFLMGGYDQSESTNESVDTGQSIPEQVAPEESVEDSYILTPGVTYVTTSSQTSTDEYGGKVSLSMEFTIYKDGSAAGNLIETNSESTYGNNNSYNHPVEGTWREVSKHDKRFLEIQLILEGDEYYNSFYYYIDEDLNAYANDINTHPVKLTIK